jgi:hypothetical protein
MNEQDLMLWSQESAFYDGDFDLATTDVNSAFYAGGSAFGDSNDAWYNQIFNRGADLIGQWLTLDAQTELAEKRGEYELEKARQQALLQQVQIPSSNTGQVPQNVTPSPVAQGNGTLLLGITAIATALLT